MNIKKASLLFVSLVLLLALFANISFAAEKDSQSLGGAFDTIRQLFGFLPELITMEKLLGGTDKAALFWAKFLVWLALFAVFYFGASFVFKDKKNIAIVVSLSFSLIGALLIPKSMLINALQTYGLLAGLLFWLVPLIAGFFVANMTSNHWLKAIIYGTAAWVLWSINETVVKEAGFINTSFPYFSLLFAATVIAFFWNLLGIGWGTAGQAGAGGWMGDRLGGAWDRVNQPSEHGLGGIFRRGGQPPAAPQAAAQQAVAREQQLQEQQQALQNVRQRLNRDVQMQQGHELEELQIIRELLNDLLQIEQQLRNLRQAR